LSCSVGSFAAAPGLAFESAQHTLSLQPASETAMSGADWPASCALSIEICRCSRSICCWSCAWMVEGGEIGGFGGG
jgi:hypothetical protein